MRKFSLVLVFVLLLTLTACGGDELTYNFRSRKDDYYISEDETIIIDYKTDENGKMIELNIDRLLTIEQMIYFNTNIDYAFAIEGFGGDIFVNAGFLCTSYENLSVPVNIEVGNTKYRYNRDDCEYQEVNRDNVYIAGTYARKFRLNDTIAVSKNIIISIVVYDINSPEKFVEVQRIPHTAKLLGVYSVPLNTDRDGFTIDGVYNYYTDMAMYEQIYLKNQKNEIALEVINGIPTDISLLDLNNLSSIQPLIEDFYLRYEDEINAINELEAEVGLFVDETEGESTEEEE